MFSRRYQNTKNGFGLLEVLISSAILILVSGAVIGLNNISVKNTVVASERTQAYNLARQWKELLKETRDTYVNDKNGNTCFSQNLNPACTNQIPSSGPYVFNSNNELEANTVGEETELNGVTFKRIIDFISPPDVIPSLADANPNIVLADQVREAIITVTWIEYNKNWSIEVPMLLTNWTAI
ncbi:MAG: hypothetical protein M1338_02825 [Patescibacteria group bacterium]|nr:hypothetical protein [Patescibacteria group bacterium]